ncbi:MAG: Holliday junction resolvase RuvX [Candidatus Pacebacteria bacterium]|nr:Holliday junction resolvase RuvX [Candidatus Paceibacterota bacterium]
MRILGIDYGTKKVGVALSDDTLSLAFPKAVLKNAPSLMGEIRGMVAANDVGEVVVGQSLKLSGEDNLLMDDIRRFVERLEKEVKLPVNLEPEFLTSAEARRGGVPEALVDASAAALILQRYLDKRKEKEE